MHWFEGLPAVIQGLLATLFTYFVTLLGAGTVIVFKGLNKKVLDMMMGFAGGVMIAASFWSLLSPSIELCEELGRPAFLEPALGFLAGGLFIIGSDIVLSKKIKLQTKSKKTVMLVSAVTLHNIPEGMAVGVAFGTLALGAPGASLIGAILLAFGIALQNFPEGACVSLPIRGEGASKRRAFLIGQATAIVEPIFGMLGVLFALFVQNLLPFLLSFSAGAMIAVVCSELIPDSFKDNKMLASFGIMTGFVIMMTLDVALS